MELHQDHLTLLRILAGQSPGYDAFPNATCFIVEGYDDFHTNQRLLEELADAGLTLRYLYDVIVKAPHEVYAELPKRKKLAHTVKGTLPPPVTETVPGGYEITDGGRQALAQFAEETTDA